MALAHPPSNQAGGFKRVFWRVWPVLYGTGGDREFAPDSRLKNSNGERLGSGLGPEKGKRRDQGQLSPMLFQVA